ncbi:MAG: hypothetical protein ACYTG2_19195 [Planctomycetota bacterium]|jgi:hypothetical protein
MTTLPARYAVCIEDAGHDVSLEAGRVYRLLPDARSEREGMLRVIDESGEDYLYPRELFVEVDLPEVASRKLADVERLRRRR